MTSQIASDDLLASLIAEAAGKVLLAVQQSGLFTDKALGKAGDAVSQAFIAAALHMQRPEDAVLSEEAVADPTRLTRSRVWIVDPLDGTREYGERRDDWAVHVALSIDGAAVAGAVALPGRGLVLNTGVRSTPAQSDGHIRMLVSRTRPAPQAVSVATALRADLVPMGSAGAKAMAVVRGEAEIYLHAGGQYEWDSCAPVAVALAAGLHVSRLDGSPCMYNAANPYMPDLLICRPELAGRILDSVAALCPTEITAAAAVT